MADKRSDPLDDIPYGRQCVTDDDIAAVAEVMASDWLTQGPEVEAFEADLARYCGVAHAVAVSSGTVALEMACRAAGLGPGDEAITVPLTFVASASAIDATGARVVFSDIDHTWTMDPDIEVSDRTRVIMPVDYGGLPCDMAPIMDIARQHDIVVIEDACHSLGGSYRGRKVGSLAHMTCISLHAVKAITSGEGGAILTDDDELAELLRCLRHHAIEPDPSRGGWYYYVRERGYNARLTGMQCAMARSQLRRLDEHVARRRTIMAMYREAIADVEGVELQAEPEGRESACHLCAIRLDGYDRREVYDAMRRDGVMVQVHYVPVHRQPYMARHRPAACPVAEAYYEGTLSLPLYPTLTDEQVSRVIDSLISHLQ